MKKTIATISLLAIPLCLAITISGCSKADKDSSPSASTPESTSDTFMFGETPVKFSFYGNYDWYTMQPWGEDPASKWIKENKKVTVTPVPAQGASVQKFNTMVASGDLPDVLWMDRGPLVEKLRQAGKLVPLDDYLNKYPNLKKYAGEETLNMLRADDGKLYQFPNWYTSTPMGNGGYMINKKIYKELGSPKLETFEDLYSYLKLVKLKAPGVVPLDIGYGTQGISVLYSGFGEDHTSAYTSYGFVPSGNELKSIFADSVFKETIMYASKLFREKLITQDALTQTKDQVVEKLNTGKVAVYASYDTADLGSQATVTLKQTDPDAGYQMIWPLHKEGVDPNKVYPNNYDTIGWNVNVITTSAKNPEGIFAYLDWLTGEEGQRIIFWGPEGLYWKGTEKDGAPIWTEKFKTDVEERTKFMAITDSFQWAGNTSFIDLSKSSNNMKLPEGQRDWAAEAQLTIAWKTSYNTTQFSNLTPDPATTEGKTLQKVADIETSVIAKGLYGGSDVEVEKIIADGENSANKAGYEKLLQYETQKWQENLKRIKKN
ncbi:ABC transporter substrate-binding protein [Paenibacillus baekrokdamisoli]|uniref:ABC transporter substrate-binding protein n=1 Tax=Paenibacillus baekrokdamisoli TaxID=1712516 RepID=A0A3G9IZE7_9BACL|nr:extracellular solute-binding protein [Paenibacillus baekrokdamisoli]MBB3068826.1 ABC-type glycerol-3-phosphate transport system substrate-binding protein [Paenibacillus baekrokdamisoli]BBH23652.1 ABC transporter substrate-binding protein [Paenibacillus baekrokdamisoli]